MLYRAWIVSLAFSLPAFAQRVLPPTPVTTETSASPAADKRIDLDVVVTDHAGKPVSGLDQHAFTIRDDKQPKDILAFRAVDASATPAPEPVQIILLVDEVNTNFTSVAFERDSIRKFLAQNGGHLAQPVTLAFFSDTETEILNGASRDGNALIAAFDQHATKLRSIRRSAGFYGAEERFQLSLRTLSSFAAAEATKPGRKVLIWISPGWPYLSGPHVDLTSREQDSLFHSIVSLSTALRHARITVYSVDPLGTEDAGGLREIYYQAFLKGVAAPKDVDAGDLALQVIATQTGGRVFTGNNDVTREIAQAAAEANSYYTLSIDASAANRPNDYNALDIKVEGAGLTARTRTGYYAQP